MKIAKKLKPDLPVDFVFATRNKKMTKFAKKEFKTIVPADIKLPERVLLENGTMFFAPKTISEFDEFWKKNNNRFDLYCNGNAQINPMFLGCDEWVFGNSKSAIVHTVLRWGKSNIHCEYYDMALSNPNTFKTIINNQISNRLLKIKNGEWTENDEALYIKQYTRYTNESTRGWWGFKNLLSSYNPKNSCEFGSKLWDMSVENMAKFGSISSELDPSDWFPGIGYSEISDINMPIGEVTRILHEQVFNEWNGDGFEVYAGNAKCIFAYIEDCKKDE